MGDWEQKKNLINELLQGMELARQLQSNLNVSSSLSQEPCELLIQKIIATFEKALAMVKWNGGGPVAEPSQAMIRMSDSPSFSGSPRSDDSDRDMKDQDLNALQRRKNLPTWTHKVRVTPGVGVEGHLDDGFSWRKYGQKDILGAKYPRGYYRCTQRVQGCLARKQVQRSDEDPTIFEINYRGKHTCTQGSNSVPTMGPQDQNQEYSNIPTMSQQLQNLQQSQELLMSFRENLRVKTNNLDSPQNPIFPSFHFPSTSIIKAENQVFPDPITIAKSFSENFSSPSYLSPPATSGSNISVPPSGLGGQSNMATSGSEINDMISAANSTPTVGFDYPFDDQFEFPQNLTFGNPRFFP